MRSLLAATLFLAIIGFTCIPEAKAAKHCPMYPGPWSFGFSSGLGKYSGWQNNASNPFSFQLPWQATAFVQRKFGAGNYSNTQPFIEASLFTGRFSGYENPTIGNIYTHWKAQTTGVQIMAGIRQSISDRWSGTFTVGIAGMKQYHKKEGSGLNQHGLEASFIETWNYKSLGMPMGIKMERLMSSYHSFGFYLNNRMVRGISAGVGRPQHYFEAGVSVRVHLLKAPNNSW